MTKFLSTLSLRRATAIHNPEINKHDNFYPRSPCGERLNDAINGCNPDFISIHALLAESDYDTSALMLCQAKFLSTLSLRRATSAVFLLLAAGVFLSTLSLRRATMGSFRSGRIRLISIHALLAESDVVVVLHIVGGANFYPRSPCGERLLDLTPSGQLIPNFYPRSPCGERRVLPS